MPSFPSMEVMLLLSGPMQTDPPWFSWVCICLLLNEPPPYTHNSTPVTTAPEVRKVDTTNITAGGDQSIYI